MGVLSKLNLMKHERTPWPAPPPPEPSRIRWADRHGKVQPVAA